MLTYADISILLQVLICELIALILGVGEEWPGAVSHAQTMKYVILIMLYCFLLALLSLFSSEFLNTSRQLPITH